MDPRLTRTARLIGEEGIRRLSRAHVLLFGLGGVGGTACEALARAGIGAFTIVDRDRVDITNLNRQTVAYEDTIGREKTQVMRERILAIHPQARVTTHTAFYLPDSPLKQSLCFEEYDYVIDCVDTVTAKIDIIETAFCARVPVISAMGAGNRLDPSALRAADLFSTDTDPLARVMRRELRKRGVTACKVVYSTEQPLKPLPQPPLDDDNLRDGTGEDGDSCDAGTHRKDTPASAPFVPPAAGLLIASVVVRDLLGACDTAFGES